MRDEFNADFQKAIRTFELEQVIRLFPPGARILEIGAGAGWQAKILSERGFDVTAIDIAQPRYRAIQEWPVVEYDGVRIPLDDASVDVVFSSNVLEHVPHIEEFMDEMTRVLKPNGLMVHVMPTTLWRVVTTVAFYPCRAKQVFRRLFGARAGSKVEKSAESAPSSAPGFGTKLRRFLCPTLHGVRGTLFLRPVTSAMDFGAVSSPAGM